MRVRPLKTVDVVRHTAIDDLGSFRGVLDARGYEVRILEPFAGDLEGIDPAAADITIVLGGAIGVNDAPSYPFISDEIRFIEKRLKSGKPILGACLGGQLMAAALGARVYKGREVEVGYLPVTLTEEGVRSPLSALAHNNYRIMHWHGDAFDLPSGATRLAHSALTPNQAFSMGPNVLALQFHMEADPRVVGGWTVAYIGDIARGKISLEELRQGIAREGQAAGEAGARTLAKWLDGLTT
jgi:GMP synthase (glutamine-hydrolysing)